MININFGNLNHLVHRETMKVIRETLDAQLSDDNEEKRRQEKLANAIGKRKLNAEDNAEGDVEDVDEAEEDEEEETAEKTSTTGVPNPQEEKREDRTGGKGTADSPKLKTPTSSQIEKPTVKSIIDKINVLRGGASLKDPKIKKSFMQYFNGLTSSEREALLVFLTGISQILAGVAQGNDAIDPADVGIKVKDTEAKKVEKITVKTPDESEDTPIIVGESQNKFLVKRVFEAYKRYE
jgi:hypothetical protein